MKNTLKRTPIIALVLAMATACNQPPPANPGNDHKTNSSRSIPDRTPVTSAGTDGRHGTPSAMEAALVRRYGTDEGAKSEARQMMGHLDRVSQYLDAQTAENQRTMVAPAPPGFRPRSSGEDLQLILAIDKSTIPPNGLLRFHLDLVNLGATPVLYGEMDPSIFKLGGLGDSRIIRLFIIDPRGETYPLTPISAASKLRKSSTRRDELVEIRPDAPDSAKEAEMRDMLARSEAESQFRVTLHPGETLRSLGDGNTMKERFRTIYSYEDFDIPGRYRIFAQLDERRRGELSRLMAHKRGIPTDPADGRRAKSVLKSNVCSFIVKP